MLQAYFEKYQSECLSESFPVKLLVDYNWYQHTQPAIADITWMPYHMMLDEFASELANTINELVRLTHRLSCWEKTITPLDDSEKLDVLLEFVFDPATVAINLQYVIRSRFIFATAHLCHQANRALQQTTWLDDLAMDDEIYFKQADQYGAPWKSYGKLKLALEKIANKDFQSSTFDFRNKYNHRFAPCIELGMSGFVTRQVDKKSGQVTYSLGSLPALKLPNIVELLWKQIDICRAAFSCFQVLVHDHLAAIGGTTTKTL